MGRIKLNPIEVINAKRVMSSSCESIKSIVKGIQNQHNGLYPKVKSRVPGIDGSVLSNLGPFEGHVNYLVNIVHELEEATGFTEDQLLSGNYDETFYEKKIYAYLMDKYYDPATRSLLPGSEYISCFVSINSNDEMYKKYEEAKIFMTQEREFFSKFDFERFNIDEYDMALDLIYLRDHREKYYLENIMDGLLNNCPSNFEDYNFNPGNQIHSDAYYNYDSSVIDNYITNSEIFEIYGHDYEIAQVFPGDCTMAEYLVYDFNKANVLNTLKSLPKDLLFPKGDSAHEGVNNVIVLTCDNNATLDKGDYGGVYKHLTYDANAQIPECFGTIVINSNGSFMGSSYYYSRYALIHELSHKFKDCTNQPDYDEIKNNEKIILSLGLGYTEETIKKSDMPLEELFAEAMAVYFEKPNELKKACPELYNLLTELLGADYGGADIGPKPGPPPESTPGPESTPVPPSIK